MSKRKRKAKTGQNFRKISEIKGNDGKYSYELYVQIGYKDAAKTKPHRKYKNIRCANDAEAQQELNKFALVIHTGDYITPEKKTLKEFFDEWVTTFAAQTLAHTTVTNYRYSWKKHIIPKLGHIRLNELKIIQLKDFMNQLDSRLAPATKLKIHNALSTVLNQAAEWELLAKNPMSGVKRPNIPKKKVQVHEQAELETLLNALRDAPLNWRIFFLLLLETGARSSEALSMTWDKVDYNKLEVEISSSAYHNGEETKLKDTKTTNSDRLVAITPDFAQVLRNYHIELGKMRDKAGEQWIDQRQFIFPNLKSGKPLHTRTPGRWLDRFIKRLDLKHITAHGFRHMHASYLLMKGVPLKIISERLGHGSIKITADIYGHVTREADREAVKQMRNIYSLDKVLSE